MKFFGYVILVFWTSGKTFGKPARITRVATVCYVQYRHQDRVKHFVTETLKIFLKTDF